MGYLRLYKKYLQIQIQSMMQYKASFCLTAVGQFLVSFNVFLGVYFMFQRFHEVEGFTYSQVLLCFAITLMEFSLAEAFARGFDTFSSTISNGEFDRIMVRPRNEIFQVLAGRIELTRIGRMLQAVVMFAYGIAKSHVEWTWDKVLTVVFMLLGGTAVFTGIFLIYGKNCSPANEKYHTTVILTTHDMQDIEALTNRIILIGKGKILLDGTLFDIPGVGKGLDQAVADLYRRFRI